ncbi:MAG TPA: hypothetical protein VFN35_15035 [Ktedonobacteraceae bacterium]|nr:hypothetical protein [Ktedonobacteraceae bacterium]
MATQRRAAHWHPVRRVVQVNISGVRGLSPEATRRCWRGWQFAQQA